MLVREKGSGARDSLEQVFKNAGLKLSVGAELSSNESIKQLCIAGLGPAYLSLHSCILEIRAGLLSVLPLENNPMNRLWNVAHLENKVLSHVASVFLGHLVQGGQAEIEEQMAMMVKMPVRGIGKLYLGNSFVFSPLLDIRQGPSTELKDPSP
jgi:DNA-binding transcriptional LysR family regulator